ncbi:MAG TPA: glycoside hydrolase family 36 protein [Candidatus Binatia bacterium]|nr:glycoside hydrolase family 36 protein [Candidatus Binatia bacterium]
MSDADRRARRFALGPYHAVVRYRRDGVPAELAIPIDPELSVGRFVEVGNRDLLVDIRIERDRAGDSAAGDARTAIVVSSHVTSRRDGIRLESVEPLSLDGWDTPPSAIRFLHNGWQSWSGTSALAGGAREPRLFPRFLREVVASPFAPATARAGRLTSDLFTALTVEGAPTDRSALALGFLRSGSQFGSFELATRPGEGPRLVARLPFDGVALAAGETRVGEPLLVQWGPPNAVPALLDAWAAGLGREMGARIPHAPTTGWCSWYEYFTRVDEAAIERNLEAGARLRARLPLDLFQIDDGYQAAIGDWLETNAKFPRGLAPIAREIAAAGFAPGVWVAPFLARPESKLAREHPGWLVRDPTGRRRRGTYNPAWGRLDSAWAIDPTHPGAAEWLADTCRTLVGDFGFRFLKLDFLFAAALPGRRRDPRATGAEALRRGLEIIRSAVGDDVHLLACGCPLGPAVGLVDSMRIGADVAPFWRDPLSRWLGLDYELPATRNAVRNAIARAFLHGRLWRNDPDCLLVRDQRTRLTPDEVQSLASVIAVSGGTLLVSDDLADLSADRLAIAERALAIRDDVADEPPVCLDLLRSGFPSLLAARARGGGAYLFALNASEEPARIELRLADFPDVARMLAGAAPGAARDVWTGETLPVHEGRLDAGRLPAHAARLIHLAGASGPSAAANRRS